MTAIGFTHVTVYGEDIDELVEFYTEMFGLEQIQAPNLGNPVAWLQCGDRQLHLVNRETESPAYHHFALAVDDFETVFDSASNRGCFDEVLAPEEGYPLYQLPDGAVQLYLRDPAGNLIEVDWPDVTTLDDRVREHITDRSEYLPQSASQKEATLYLDPSLLPNDE